MKHAIEETRVNLHLVLLIGLYGSDVALVMQRLGEDVAFKKLKALSKVYKNVIFCGFLKSCMEEAHRANETADLQISAKLWYYVTSPAQYELELERLKMRLVDSLDNYDMAFNSDGKAMKECVKEINNIVRTVYRGERDCTCLICGKLYTNLEKVRDHILAHKSIRFFRCVVCDGRFAKKQNLQVHLRRYHSMN